MTPLMVKGVLFGLLLLSAAVWDMRNREIPNLIPALLLLCGLIGFRPAASVAGLFLVGGPFLLAAVLIKRALCTSTHKDRYEQKSIMCSTS